MEWFDFGLFIFMAPIIGAKFFPRTSAGNATIEALIVFAAGFLCRPLGGIFFGYFGDTRGRAKTLRISSANHFLSTSDHTNRTRKNKCDDFSIYWRHFNIYYSGILIDYVEFKLLYDA